MADIIDEVNKVGDKFNLGQADVDMNNVLGHDVSQAEAMAIEKAINANQGMYAAEGGVHMEKSQDGHIHLRLNTSSPTTNDRID